MLRFTYQALSARVIFGAGSLERLPDEIQLLGASRALVLATPEQRDQAQAVAGRIGPRAVGVFARATMHVPIATAEAARAEAKRLAADCCIAVGGGSTTVWQKPSPWFRRFRFLRCRLRTRVPK